MLTPTSSLPLSSSLHSFFSTDIVLYITTYQSFLSHKMMSFVFLYSTLILTFFFHLVFSFEFIDIRLTFLNHICSSLVHIHTVSFFFLLQSIVRICMKTVDTIVSNGVNLSTLFLHQYIIS